MRIAACAYRCDWLPDAAAQSAKLDALLVEARADLLVLPEYAAMEAAMIGAPKGLDAMGWRDRAAAAAEGWVDRLQALARTHRCHILAGTGPAATAGGVVNRAWLITPSGRVAHQDKLIPTPYERSAMQMRAGAGLMAFDTALGRIGVLICYDSEFPLLARALVETGVETILVPSCTELPAGQTRVRQSARARAIEGQCLVVQAPLVGDVPGCEVIDRNTGRAALFCPPDIGLPSDGIVAQGPTDLPGPVVAKVDPAAIIAPRAGGQVSNFGHWPEQIEPAQHVTVQAIA